MSRGLEQVSVVWKVEEHDQHIFLVFRRYFSAWKWTHLQSYCTGAKSVMVGIPLSFVFTTTFMLYTYSQSGLCDIAPYIALGNRAFCLAHSCTDICQGAGVGVFCLSPFSQPVWHDMSSRSSKEVCWLQISQFCWILQTCVSSMVLLF